MKTTSIFFLCFFLLLCCADDHEELTREQLSQLIFERLEQHAEIMDDVIVGGRIITGNCPDVRQVAITVDNRDEFLSALNDLTDQLYNEELGEWLVYLHRQIDPAPQIAFQKMQDYLLPYPTGYTGPNPGSGVLDAFAADVQSELDSRQGEHVLLESFVFEGSTGARPIGNMTISYTGLEIGVGELQEIIISKSMDSDGMDAAIEDLLASATPEQKVLFGMLLPAVNSSRESTSYNDMMNDLFDFTPQERMEWDRDVRIAALYGATDFILSDEFDPTDDLTAAMYINRQIYDIIMIMTWARAYDVCK